MMHGVTFTPLEKIESSGGEILRAMRSGEAGFRPVQEAYFSSLRPSAVRAWKRHQEMIVNLVVAAGAVEFVAVDESAPDPRFEKFRLGPEISHGRLTIEPGTWFGFQAGESGGLILNLADTIHRDDELEKAPLDKFGYEWSQQPPRF